MQPKEFFIIINYYGQWLFFKVYAGNATEAYLKTKKINGIDYSEFVKFIFGEDDIKEI